MRSTTPPRLFALDLARLIAIVGMVAAHLLSPVLFDDSGSPFERGVAEVAEVLASGNASTLFAVLGGGSVVLASRTALAAGQPGRAVARIALRGALVALIGLLLGLLDVPIVIVLVPFGVAMMCAAPLMLLSSPVVGAIAAVLALVGGTANALLREALDVVQEVEQIGPADLLHPGELLRSVFVTGMYPVLTWLPYMLLGMLLARFLVAGPSRRRLAGVGLAGVAAVIVAQALSALIGRPGALSVIPDPEYLSFAGVGAPLSTAPWAAFLAVPHTGTITDMLSTAGVAVAVIMALSMALPLGRPLPRVLAPLRAAGAAPLSSYVLHVGLTALFLGIAPLSDESAPWYVAGAGVFLLNVAIILLLGLVLAVLHRRGPLEALVGGTVARLVPLRTGTPVTR